MIFNYMLNDHSTYQTKNMDLTSNIKENFNKIIDLKKKSLGHLKKRTYILEDK